MKAAIGAARSAADVPRQLSLSAGNEPPEAGTERRRSVIHNTSKQRLWIATQVSCLAVCGSLSGESLKPSENEKGESNNVEVYLWSISRWHYRSSVDVPVAD